MADDGFRRRAQDERFGEFFAAADGDDRKLGRKAFDVMFFLVDKAAGNQQRKRDVLVAGGFEAAVQRLLHVFPERPAVGPHDHAAAHRRVVGQLRLQYQLVVPLGKIFCAGRELFFSHAACLSVLLRREIVMEQT